MKATDLMIGDWVMLDMNWAEDDPMYARPNYQPYQIKRSEDIDLAQETNCIGDAGAYQPIPLTAEVLEKNGFKKRIGRYGGKEDMSYECGNILDGTIIVRLHDYTRIFSGTQMLFCMSLGYVHKLQHALRLCGIEKEIML